MIGQKEITLPCSICGYVRETPNIIEIDKKIIVCMSSWNKDDRKRSESFGFNEGRNIQAFDLEGNKLWEVETIVPTCADDIRRNINDYTGFIIENGKLIAENLNSNSNEYTIDMQTGKILESKFTGYI